MQEKFYDCIIIGAGAAGTAAAVRCKDLGIDVIMIENKRRVGGIPLQCTHPGFGNFYYKENLTGTEFAEKLTESSKIREVESLTEAHVVSIEDISDTKKKIDLVTPKGVFTLYTGTIIYATGAREKHRFETGIQGDRLSGVYTAGEAQTLMDIYGVLPGKKVVIIGSGDIGLIMARRFALEGAEVVGVIEMMPYPGGLTRNVVQCLHDFDIPLHTKKRVIEIRGNKRVEKLTTMDVNDDMKTVPGSENSIRCDTVALATGLIPYTKILDKLDVVKDSATGGPVVDEYLMTSIPGIFAAGNVLAVNDYVDFAAYQGERAAEGVVRFLRGDVGTSKIKVERGRNVRFAVPQYISENDVTLYGRVKKPEPGVRIMVPEIGYQTKNTSVNPGEMIRLDINKRDLEGIGDKITVEVTR
ncbi:MAG: FAD-dependent oxidoreductase [Thermoplasmata archaeon]